jgi:2-methylcitrate dehydratase PrpD
VTVRTAAGAFQKEVLYSKGEPEFPLTDVEMRAKFEANARSLYPADRVRRIYDTIMSIESRRMRELTALLAAPPPGR